MKKAKEIKIPEQLRITLKDQWSYEYLEGGGHIKTLEEPLGFANVYDPHTKAYAKREKTQDDWAYSNHEVEDDGTLTTSCWVYNSKLRKNEFIKSTVESHLLPIIIDNIPLEGFRVQKSVSRYSTSNKLWRILDPRGFELEIATATMEDLIDGGVIDRGLIVGKCVWRTGKILVRV